MQPIRLVLASASPRRRELLAQLGLTFDVTPADLDEAVRPGELPDAYVEQLAREKARAVTERVPGSICLAADTSVVVDDVILGKPGRSAIEGAAMLDRLSGRAHVVMTGIAVAGESVESQVVKTTVHFRKLSAAEIDWYVSTGEGRDKAGGYASQARAGAFITRMEGSATSVIGLPLSEAVELLERAGFPMPWSGK